MYLQTEAAAGNSAFAVNDGETAVAGIDLSLVNSANQKVTFSGGTATVTTYIVPGLDPANISVKYNGDGDDATFVSYNAETGELKATLSSTSRSETISTIGWPKGIYIIKITIGKEELTKKTLVQ